MYCELMTWLATKAEEPVPTEEMTYWVIHTAVLRYSFFGVCGVYNVGC